MTRYDMTIQGISIVDLIERLKRVPAFSSLEPSAFFSGIDFFATADSSILAEIAPGVRLDEYPAGAIVCRHGMFDERFHVILSGNVWAVIPTEENPRYRLYSLGPGDFFGEEILYSSGPRESSIIADETLLTLSMDAEVLRRLVESSNTIRGIMERKYIERTLKSDLRRVPIFTNLDEKLFSEVLAKAELVSLPAGCTVFREGDPGDAFYMIREGEVNVFRRSVEGDRLIAILGEGQVFGEMSLLSDERRNATLTTSNQTDLVRISREDFLAIVARDGRMMQELNEVVDERRMHQRDALRNPNIAVISRKLLDLNRMVGTHLDIISQCVVDTRYGAALLATLPGSRYPYVYPRDSACASRFLYRLATSQLNSSEIALRLLGEIARFIAACQREDGYWGQRYGTAAEDKGIYRQEDNVAHGVTIICRYLLAAAKRGMDIPGVERYFEVVRRGLAFALRNYYRKEIHLFYSTTSIHESAIEEGYTIWVNYAYLCMLKLIGMMGETYGVAKRFAEAKELESGFTPTVEKVFVQSGRYIRRLKPDGTVDLRPDITLLSPFFFGTGMGHAGFEANQVFRESINFIVDMLWDPELGMLQRYLPFIEDPETHIHAGNGPWVQYTAMLAQYFFHSGMIDRGNDILAIIDRYRTKEGYLCEHLTTPERFNEFKHLEWTTGRDVDKEFDPHILLPGIPYDHIVEELNHMRDSYARVERQCGEAGSQRHISFAAPLMWSHAEYAMALIMRTEKEIESCQ